MGKLKTSIKVCVGFEKKFASLTECVAEIKYVLGSQADINGIFETPMGKLIFSYSVNGNSDKDLELQARILEKDGGLWKLPDGKEVVPAEVKADKGKVVIISWQGYSCGWEPHKDGGFQAFIETWSGRCFREDKGLSMISRASSYPQRGLDGFDSNMWAKINQYGRTELKRKAGDVSKFKDRLDAWKKEQQEKLVGQA